MKDEEFKQLLKVLIIVHIAILAFISPNFISSIIYVVSPHEQIKPFDEIEIFRLPHDKTEKNNSEIFNTMEITINIATCTITWPTKNYSEWSWNRIEESYCSYGWYLNESK